MDTILFFGYGTYRDREKIKRIIGRDPGEGEDAILEGYDLLIQTLDQIPSMARKVLEKVWGEKFRAYTIRKGNGIIIGKIWKLDKTDIDKIKDWEFMNGSEQWRELATVTIKSKSGETFSVVTEKALDSQYTKETVNGLEYVDNLNMDLENMVFWKKNDEYRTEEIARIRREIQAQHLI
jgi:hypothetical protein